MLNDASHISLGEKKEGWKKDSNLEVIYNDLRIWCILQKLERESRGSSKLLYKAGIKLFSVY